MVALLMRTPVLSKKRSQRWSWVRSVADEALLNPCLVLMEGAGAARGGSGGEISTLAVAAEVATDGGGSNVERVCGFMEGVTLV